MSMECGECERDLRGGHDISCSRYNLERGVAEVMTRSVGIEPDDDFPMDPRWLAAAKAAIEHVRAYDACRPSLSPGAMT